MGTKKKKEITAPPATPPSNANSKVRITSPARDASISSPLLVLCARYEGARSRRAKVRVGGATHHVELASENGELRQNVTLLEGHNEISVEIEGVTDKVSVDLPKSSGIALSGSASEGTPRVLDLTGTWKGASCPAGVISCNGFMQQFACLEEAGNIGEKVVLRPGDNNVAVQIGELYATKLVKASFAPAKIVVTLVWDTPGTDVDLYVIEPDGTAVYYSNKKSGQGGLLDVDRTSGFGPENYSIRRPRPGRYRLRVHFYRGGGGFAAGGVARTEWNTRVVIDEGTTTQRQRSFWGYLEVSNGSNATADSTGPDWNEICVIDVAPSGEATFVSQGNG